MATTSSDRGFQVPVVGGDSGQWGYELNATLAGIDSILGGSVTLYSSAYGNSATLTSSQAQCGRVVISGTSSQDFVLTLPSSNFARGNFTVLNEISGGGGILCQTLGGGPTAYVQPGLNNCRIVNCDGYGCYFADTPPIPVLPNPNVAMDFCIAGGGVPPSPGWYGFLRIPFSFTTSSYTLNAEQSGSAAVLVFHNYAQEAGLSLSGATSFGGGYGPVRYNPNDTMGFYLQSAATLQSISISITGTRSLSS